MERSERKREKRPGTKHREIEGRTRRRLERRADETSAREREKDREGTSG